MEYLHGHLTIQRHAAFFSIDDNTTTDNSLTVLFQNNVAFATGDSIYINTPSKACNKLDSAISNFTSAITSGVHVIQIYRSVHELILGQNITIEAKILDFYQHPTSVEIYAHF